MSIASSLQLQSPVHSIIFDCDGTLSTLEGIDTLADQKSVGSEVQVLTAEAMGKLGMNPDLYRQRLDIVRPSLDQVLTLGHLYFINRVPDIEEVIRIFHRLNKSVYIISAGLLPAVRIFGELLQIPRENIFAVDIQFDEQGNYKDFDHQSPLTESIGKRILISATKDTYRDSILVGDGLNDLAAKDVVTRFIGYGGCFYRKNIETQCDYYIKSKSMAALLPLALTMQEVNQLDQDEKKLYEKGLSI